MDCYSGWTASGDGGGGGTSSGDYSGGGGGSGSGTTDPCGGTDGIGTNQANPCDQEEPTEPVNLDNLSESELNSMGLSRLAIANTPRRIYIPKEYRT